MRGVSAVQSPSPSSESRCTISLATPMPAHGQLQLVSSEDGGVLLDIDHDRILRLNPVGTEMWKLLSAGEREPEIVQRISRQYQVDQARVAEDVRALLKRISELRVSPANSMSADCTSPKHQDSGQVSYPWYGPAGDQRPTPSALGVFTAFIGLAIFDLILWLFSLKLLCSCVKAWPVGRRKPDPIISGKLCNAVEQASVWYPKKALCLQRSAVTTCILRSHGVAARMVIGMRTIPFLAHAWVEVDGSVVNDWRSVAKFYCATISC
jgi:hypothetical protein